MKKLRIAALALGLLILSSLPALQAHAAGGHYYVYIYSFTHWLCVAGGYACCPGVGC